VKIIIAPDSFKGSLSAPDVSESIAVGIRRVLPEAECVLIPLADGGEGTVESLVQSTGGKIIRTQAIDPLGRRMESFFGILGDGVTAVVEMAAASGLPLVPENLRNPLNTTSYGTGELIKAALDSGCRKLILGIGGSATNDGGIGMVQALGGRFLDESGKDVGFGGKELASIRAVDVSGLDSRLRDVTVTVACDVDNPLVGERGASAIFGPQKGANPDMVRELDAGLHNLADVIERDLGVDVKHMPGAGAAGGIGAASVAFLHAELRSGIEIVLDATRFESALDGASLVITGEGRIDSQTLSGKTICGVLNSASAKGVPVLALGGGIGEGGYDLLEHGAIAVLSITNKPMDLEYAQKNASELLARASEQAIRLLAAGLFCG
jgi:glycerate kinase